MDVYQKIIIASALIIIGLSGGFWLGGGMKEGANSQTLTAPPQSTPETLPIPSTSSGQAPTAPNSGTVLTGENALALDDQAPGTSVAVNVVTLARDGWVVIHEEEGGKPGRILGARRFNAGMNQSGSVELLRPTEEGKIYFAMLHADNGDHQFNHTKDMPIKDGAGNAVMMRFVATANPPEH